MKAAKSKAIILGIAALIFSTGGCTKKIDTEKTTGQWLIDRGELYQRGIGKGGIPSIDVPVFEEAYRATYLHGFDLVIGIKVNGEFRAYPYSILRWHEIVNDISDSTYFSVLYSPLSASPAVWDRGFSGDSTSFGICDLVFNGNHLVFDYVTDSYWLPIKSICVNGPRIGEYPHNMKFVEMSWDAWREMYPDTRVLSDRTGYVVDYRDDPYPHYSTDNDMLFYPISHYDNRLPNKERVHVIVLENYAKAYRISSMPDSMYIINDIFHGLPVIIAGANEKRLAVSFNRQLHEGTVLEFHALQDSLPAMMVDDEGTIWDVFGEAVSGPRAGEQLESLVSFNAYWFAIAATYPDIVLYEP